MGDPKKSRRKYKTPGHPYESERITEEARLLREFGLSNKKEIWRSFSLLRKWQTQARDIIALPDEEKIKEEEKLIHKLNSTNLLPKASHIDDVLALELRAILDRRLQTQVYKMGLSNSIKQSRQFILHRKVTVNGKKITSPSYLVKTSDSIRFVGSFNPKIKEVVTMIKHAKNIQQNIQNPEMIEEVENGKK